MSENADARRVIGEVLSEIIEEARCGVKKIPIGLMARGSEVGAGEAVCGARTAMRDNPYVKVVMIGPKAPGSDDLEWIETADDEAAVSEAMDAALESGRIAGAVALHHPFPLGVATIGRVVTPARGKPCFIASSTGTSATGRVESMIRNAVYGISVAKACGISKPTVGLLNLDGAQTALRALEKLKAGGYEIEFGASVRKDGGAILRGNDLLVGAVDVCVTDTLTGNIIMKLFSSWNTGGEYEASGWGYGPSVGEGWRKTVSIISRASGAPVIAGALSYTAQCLAGGISGVVEREMAAAKKAGLAEIIESLQAKAAPVAEVKAPPCEPTEEEIHGIDVLSIDDATKALWKEEIYAESSMGCTGPVIKVSLKNIERAKEVLSKGGYL